jgi:hypothetical protein
MKWMLLFVLVACSTPEKTEEVKKSNAQEVSSATESEAKPVSPLTVKPCYCMKMFQPVCAGGKNYGNSCEAECQGHKKWTMGECPTEK